MTQTLNKATLGVVSLGLAFGITWALGVVLLGIATALFEWGVPVVAVLSTVSSAAHSWPGFTTK